MKKILLIITGLVLALSSCSKLDFDYTPTNDDITFSVNSATYSLEGEEIIVQLQRGVLDKEASLNLVLTDAKGVYTLKTPTVTFAAGANKAEAVLSYNLSDLQPVVNYNFTLAFSDADAGKVAVSGFATFTARASMPLEYEDYGTIACRSGSFVGLLAAPDRVFNLQLAKYTTTYFRIQNLYNSGTDLEFIFDPENGTISITSPEESYYNATQVANYPLHKIETGIKHPSYGTMFAYIDSNPTYTVWSNLSAEGTIQQGSILSLDVWYAVSAGYFGWYTDTFIATEVK